ncbi:hypothetical protein TRAPUB_11389 [Trametes pubescens]|uniref:Uncharacterized protein n=1 Tax=Trametes pubescens TaxID=154538 RepID=A0A1M2VWT2_TRAPU|nr:hypothetical protein TRAPUB_11389 [Trametes pubescens]
MDMEVRYVRWAPKASQKRSWLLYIYNRYMSILWNLLKLGVIGTMTDTLTHIISSILSSRFLLALYETNARLERGGSSASSFSTLDFGEADPRAAGSPELPEFLQSLGGPIQSFPDHDPELFDPEPTTVQQEPEAEVEVRMQTEADGRAQAQAQADVEEEIGEVEGLARV